MPSITYNAADFPSSSSTILHGEHSLSVSWHEIVWAAVSVGKRGVDDMLAHNSHSINEIRFRSYTVLANLWERRDRVVRSPVYDDLDPTEKGSISFFLGMTLAKLFAWRLLRAPWMIHLDRLVDTHAVGLTGRSRPDLAGQDLSGRWILVEAKGRTGSFSQPAMQQAKAQVCEVRDIDGACPHLRVGMQMYFAPVMRMVLVDPEEPRRDSVSLTIGIDQFRSMYYRRLTALRSTSQRKLSLRDISFEFVDYESIGVSVGIADVIGEVPPKQALEPLFGVGDENEIEQEETKGGIAYRVFPDGVAIGLDDRWSKAAMETMPHKR